MSLALVPMAMGVASTGSPLTTLVMASVPEGRAGVGSAMNDTSREVGGALGVAVLGSLVTTQFTSSLDSALRSLLDALRDQANSGLPGALDVAGRLTGGDGAVLAEAARTAYADGPAPPNGSACPVIITER